MYLHQCAANRGSAARCQSVLLLGFGDANCIAPAAPKSVPVRGVRVVNQGTGCRPENNPRVPLPLGLELAALPVVETDGLFPALRPVEGSSSAGRRVHRVRRRNPVLTTVTLREAAFSGAGQGGKSSRVAKSHPAGSW